MSSKTRYLCSSSLVHNWMGEADPEVSDPSEPPDAKMLLKFKKKKRSKIKAFLIAQRITSWFLSQDHKRPPTPSVSSLILNQTELCWIWRRLQWARRIFGGLEALLDTRPRSAGVGHKASVSPSTHSCLIPGITFLLQKHQQHWEPYSIGRISTMLREASLQSSLLSLLQQRVITVITLKPMTNNTVHNTITSNLTHNRHFLMFLSFN